MAVGKGGFLTSPRFSHGESVSAVTSPRPLRSTVVVAYVVPATFGAALLRILGSPLLRLLVLQRAAAAAIDLVVAAAIATAAATAVATRF